MGRGLIPTNLTLGRHPPKPLPLRDEPQHLVPTRSDWGRPEWPAPNRAGYSFWGCPHRDLYGISGLCGVADWVCG